MPVASRSVNPTKDVGDAEQILERIVELEDLLLENRGRKPKFQELKLQAEWSSELEELNSQLEL